MKFSELHVGAFAWIPFVILFLLYELPAAAGWVPWPTLSGTVWDAIHWWEPFRFYVAAFLIVLGLHFCVHLAARWLILSAVLWVVALTVHVLLV